MITRFTAILVVGILINKFAEGQARYSDSMVYYNNTKKPAISNPQIIEYAPTIQADGKTIIFEANRSITSGSFNLFSTQLENGTWQPPISLDKINSSGDSLDLIGGPSISFDGNILYFFRSVGVRANLEIFYSVREKDGWGVPVNIGSPINTEGYEGFPSISADGSTLYFVRQNVAGPVSKELRKELMFCTSIYMSKKNSTGEWSIPEKLPWPINQDCEKAPRIMADGRTLIFSSNRPGGYGGFDMFQSTLNDLGEWSIPFILDYVNTDKDDQLPCISAQGDLMYYTYNNADIYSVVIPPKLRQFMNNIVQGFVTDVDLKSGIGAEIIVTDALTSERVMNLTNNPSDGRFTIVLPVGRNFNVEFKKEGYSSFTYSLDLRNKHKYEEISLDVELFKTVRLNMVVNDVELFEPILAEIKIREKGQNSFIKDENNNPKTGRYNIDLEIGKSYEVIVSANHFKSEILNLDASGLVIYREFDKYIDLVPEKINVMVGVADLVNNSKVKSKVIIRNKSRDEIIEVEGNQLVSLRAGDRYEVEVTSDQGYAFNSTTIDLTTGQAQNINVPLQKLEQNTKLTLKDINFESNSDQLSDISFEELNRVIKLMKENPTLKVEIAAHTDDVGSDVFNLTLSNKRASSVVDYLINNNISSDRFIPKGYGEAQFKYANDSDENRAKNRRVELIIVSI